MKKSNTFTLTVLSVMIIAVLIYSVFLSFKKQDEKAENNPPQSNLTSVDFDSSENSNNDDNETITESITSFPEITGSANQSSDLLTPAVKMPCDSLFIGDSRTVGLMEYSSMQDTDFFCDTGMTLFDIHKKRLSVYKTGKVTLKELLSNKKYDNIYLMLGINELGYKFDSIVNKYSELIKFIQEYQPDAKIFIQANLHVTDKRSKNGDYINNTKIDELNLEISKFADNSKIFYMNANPLFDDENGNLSAEKTADDAHLYAKYYADWGKWICNETAKYIKEG